MEARSFATTDLSNDAYGVALIPAIANYAAGAGGLGDRGEWADELRRLGAEERFFASIPQYCYTAVRP